jgi:hypothetical protein
MYEVNDSTSGGALVERHGVTSSIPTKTIRPAKKPKTSKAKFSQADGGSTVKITNFFSVTSDKGED